MRKTRARTVNTLHVGRFRAREVFRLCQPCHHTYRSEELCALVPPGANVGYDVTVYAGKALFLRHRNEADVLDVFSKKTRETPPSVIRNCRRRLRQYDARAGG